MVIAFTDNFSTSVQLSVYFNSGRTVAIDLAVVLPFMRYECSVIKNMLFGTDYLVM